MPGIKQESLVQDLQRDFRGVVFSPGADGYDGARSLFNAMIDVHPAVIAQCADAGDVQTALRAGREAGLEIAVRSGGHSVAGMSTVEGRTRHRRAQPQGRRGRRRRSDRALRRGPDVGRVRRRHAGARAGHDRRSRVDHGRVGLHARRRLRLARTLLRPGLRQPAGRRARDRRRRVGPGQLGLPRRSVLGAARRRRQLRRRNGVRVRPAPASARRCSRASCCGPESRAATCSTGSARWRRTPRTPSGPPSCT